MSDLEYNKVLLVDDEPDIHDFKATILKGGFYSSDGSEWYRRYKYSAWMLPHLIILDVMMRYGRQ